jgi:hypothetical protein
MVDRRYDREGLRGTEDENDPLWNLLGRAKNSKSVKPSPWFVTRTVAMATSAPQSYQFFRYLFRFIGGICLKNSLLLHSLRITIISGLSAALLLTLHGYVFPHPLEKAHQSQIASGQIGLKASSAHPWSSPSFVSTDQDFKDHIELLTSTD